MPTNGVPSTNGQLKINGARSSEEKISNNTSAQAVGPTIADFVKTGTGVTVEAVSEPNVSKESHDPHDNTIKSSSDCILSNAAKTPATAEATDPNKNSESKGTALEALSQNNAQLDNFARIDPKSPIKNGDIIAFKVFTPSLEVSNYIIALVEVVHIPSDKSFDTINMDYDLTIEIMGKDFIYVKQCAI